MPNTFADRLNQAIQLRGIRPIDLSKETGISKGRISQYRSGLYTPKAKDMSVIADTLSVNMKWLMGEDVPMEEETRKPTKEDFERWEALYNPNGILAAEVQILEMIDQVYGREVMYDFGNYVALDERERKKLSDILSRYMSLDEIDRAEVRGYVLSRVEAMLQDPKYLSQKKLRDA